MRGIAGIVRCFVYCAFILPLPLAAQSGLELEQHGQWKQAELAWRTAIQQNPKDGVAYAHLGLVLARQGDYAQAAAAYRRSIALKTNLPGLELNLGLALFKEEKFAEAIFPLKAAAAEAPDNMQTKILLGMSYYGSARYADAVPYLEDVVAQTPDNIELRTTLAQSCLWSEHYDCVLAQYKQIVTLAPESVQADMLAGEAYDGLQDREEAIRAFQAAAQAGPNEPNVHFGLGYLFWKAHRYSEAKQEFARELENNPHHAQARAYLADTEMKLNDNAAAQSLLEEAVKEPDAPRIAFVDQGILDAEEKHNDEALANFQHAIAMDPAEIDAHWRLARLYTVMGKKQEAQAEFEKVSQLHKTEDEALVKKISEAPRSKSQ